MDFLETNETKLIARKDGKLFFLSWSQVLYAEYVDRHVYLYTKNEVFRSVESLENMEEKSKFLVRCSKNAVINIKHVNQLKSVTAGRIIATLSNEEQILISRHYASVLRNVLQEKKEKTP